MAGGNKTKQKPEPKPEAISKYSQAELLAQAEAVFKQPRFVVVGAFYGAADPLTLDEAKDLVDRYVIKEVKD